MENIQRQDRSPVTYQFRIAGPLLAWQRTEGIVTRHNSRQQNAFQKMVGLLCLEARTKNRERMIPAGVPVRLTVRVFYPRPKSVPHNGSIWKTSRPDLDNLVKTIKDALNGVAYVDDAQVCQDGGSEKKYSTQPIETEYAVVEIAELL